MRLGEVEFPVRRVQVLARSKRLLLGCKLDTQWKTALRKDKAVAGDYSCDNKNKFFHGFCFLILIKEIKLRYIILEVKLLSPFLQSNFCDFYH